jgi:hypothetical protein
MLSYNYVSLLNNVILQIYFLKVRLHLKAATISNELNPSVICSNLTVLSLAQTISLGITTRLLNNEVGGGGRV